MDCNNILTQTGNTPLNKLKQELELTKCNIYKKIEYFSLNDSVEIRFLIRNSWKVKIYQYQIGYSI